MSTSYDDIINLPHHISKKHPQMSMADRAAQFSPFAALTGHEDAIKETGRLTDRQITFDENERSLLNWRLNRIAEHLSVSPVISIVYFEPDLHKSGGSYREISGVIAKIDQYSRVITLQDNIQISLDHIISIDSDDITM